MREPRLPMPSGLLRTSQVMLPGDRPQHPLDGLEGPQPRPGAQGRGHPFRRFCSRGRPTSPHAPGEARKVRGACLTHSRPGWRGTPAGWARTEIQISALSTTFHAPAPAPNTLSQSSSLLTPRNIQRSGAGGEGKALRPQTEGVERSVGSHSWGPTQLSKRGSCNPPSPVSVPKDAPEPRRRPKPASSSRGGAWPPSPLTPATLRPRTDPSAVSAPAGRPSPDPGRRPPPAAPPRRPHQCQLFTLVPSSRSSTIQRGSPWPHLAMAEQTGRKTRKGQGAAAPKPAFPAAEPWSGAFAAPRNCQKAPPRRGAPGSPGRDLRGGSYGHAEAGRG